MSDATATLEPPAASEPTRANPPHLGWAVAGLSAAAGVIHFAMVPVHAGGSLLDPIGFAVVGWFQLAVAAAILADRAGKNLYRAAVIGNLAVLGLWLWSRTAGLPFGEHAGSAEEFGLIDGAASALAAGVVLLSARLLVASNPDRVGMGRLAPALFAIGALGLATTVITSPDAASHGHSDEEVAAPVDAHTALMNQIDADRCDRDLNIQAYWDEAEYLEIDTYQGGAMSMAPLDPMAAPASGDGHGHSHGAAPAAAEPGPTTTTEPDPTEGRGSEELDDLISLTSLAGNGEVAAGQLVSTLAEYDDETYDTWLWWLKATGQLSHGHGGHGEDGGGHGGHVGPQPWVAMTDPAQCAQLAEELELARETALKYPTAADATAAGWYKVTGYVPGIAAHYINGDLIDGEFKVDEPEMLLYDGNGPEANIVGLSYYIWHDGDLPPTSGFTGANDHGHRHVGLCTGPGGVIGDTTTTEEECAARGGVKADGSKGWMSHAWVVPGCESPWGVFSAATPILDSALREVSGEDGGACAGSSVRERYGLDTITPATPASTGGN